MVNFRYQLIYLCKIFIRPSQNNYSRNLNFSLKFYLSILLCFLHLFSNFNFFAILFISFHEICFKCTHIPFLFRSPILKNFFIVCRIFRAPYIRFLCVSCYLLVTIYLSFIIGLFECFWNCTQFFFSHNIRRGNK